MKPTKKEIEFFDKGFKQGFEKGKQDTLLLMRSAINSFLKDKKNLGDVKLEKDK